MGRSSGRSQGPGIQESKGALFPPSLTGASPSAAPGWASDGSAVPIPGLADVQGHARVQAFLPEAHPPSGQVAGGIQRRGRPHGRTLLVSIP